MGTLCVFNRDKGVTPTISKDTKIAYAVIPKGGKRCHGYKVIAGPVIIRGCNSKGNIYAVRFGRVLIDIEDGDKFFPLGP